MSLFSMEIPKLSFQDVGMVTSPFLKTKGSGPALLPATGVDGRSGVAGDGGVGHLSSARAAT